MICKKCYTNNEDGAKFCLGCGEKLEETTQTVSNPNVQSTVANNQGQTTNNTNYSNAQNSNVNNNVQYNNAQNVQNDGSIPVYNQTSAIIACVVSVLCCSGMIGLIFAILSLVEGGKVKDFVRQGDINGAWEKLNQAKKWNKISWIVIGVFGGLSILYILFVFLMALLGSM